MTLSPQDLLDDTTDFLGVFGDVSGADLEAWNKAASFKEGAFPAINEAWEKAEYPLDQVRRLADLGLFTDGLDVEGYDTFSPLAAGLVNMEISRCDGSMATAIAVQAGLTMRSIDLLGSDEQKAYWLPKLASAEKLGAFALTEPDHGSDSIALETSAVRDGDEFVLNGQKRWIGHGSVGDITVVWARTEDGEVSGFLVPQDAPGYEAETIQGKVSLRAIPQALITLKDCRIPVENQLPKAKTFRDTARVLTATRLSVGWMALGNAVACYEIAREHAATRVQFGRPLAANQMIQQRLSDMLGKLTHMMLLMRRVTDLESRSELSQQQASMAKVQCTRGSREIALNARDMLGGSGILLENHVMRHFVDNEAIHTYEGTDTMQSLIIGKKITGIGAYK